LRKTSRGDDGSRQELAAPVDEATRLCLRRGAVVAMEDKR